MNVLSLILLFVAFLSNAQEPKIVSITSDDRIFRGYIGEEYPFTMYLKVANFSDNVGYVYSVDGWYQYDKIGTPIPLAGIWTGSQMHLFTSDDSNFLDNLINFSYKNEEREEYLDNYLNDLASFTAELPEITERFHLEIGERGISGNWQNKVKELPVSINGSRTHILNETDYLMLPNGQYFDLLNLGIPSRADFELEASANDGKNLVLHYTYHANLNYMGRCGGAVNTGKVGLEFDNDYQLSSYTTAAFEDCYQDITVDDLIKVSETITHYKIHNYSSSNDERYAVDSQNATVKRVEK